jgi:hypothetical protein
LAIKKLALSLLLALLLLQGAAAPFAANSYRGLARPFAFSLMAWEVRSLAAEARDRLTRPFRPSPTDEAALVRGFFEGQGEAQGGTAPAQVEASLEAAVARVLQSEGVGGFPPVAFRFDSPPLLLAVSPRERIELIETVLLRPGLDTAQLEGLEREVEAAKGVSALVEGVGGIATYPSLIPAGYGLQDTVSAVAHEWLHHYFFFRPLGRAYGRDYQMTTLNETAADLAAKEIAGLVLRGYGVEPVEPGEAAETPFDREMRAIRQEVDRLLGEGRVEDAEVFMEDSRQRLADLGYHIRRLNQAYFAFHGSYAQSPQSTSPIGKELERLREKAGSLGEFIRLVAGVGSYQELKGLAY